RPAAEPPVHDAAPQAGLTIQRAPSITDGAHSWCPARRDLRATESSWRVRWGHPRKTGRAAPESLRRYGNGQVRRHLRQRAVRGPGQPRGAKGTVMSGSTSQTPDETYQHGHHASVVSNHAKRTAEDCAGFFLPFLKPGMRLLDVGCGPGSITVGLARRVAPAETVGIDMSESVIAPARSTRCEEHH